MTGSGLYLAALRAYWTWGLLACVAPPVLTLTWMFSRPVVYEARASVQCQTEQADAELVLWLTSRTIGARAGVEGGETLTAAKRRTDPVIDIVARAGSEARAVAVVSTALRESTAAMVARERLWSENARTYLVAILQQLRLTGDELTAVARAVEEARRRSVGVAIMDVPAAVPLPRVRAVPLVAAGALGLILGMGAVLTPAWIVALRRELEHAA